MRREEGEEREGVEGGENSQNNLTVSTEIKVKLPISTGETNSGKMEDDFYLLLNNQPQWNIQKHE